MIWQEGGILLKRMDRATGVAKQLPGNSFKIVKGSIINYVNVFHLLQFIIFAF
jgi:hypothetical protein